MGMVDGLERTVGSVQFAWQQRWIHRENLLLKALIYECASFSV